VQALATAKRIHSVYAKPESYQQERDANSNVYRSRLGNDKGHCTQQALKLLDKA
jgi:hypothetical protein